MAMSLGGSKVNISEINVTPMIDILLVLLIIFMVIAPAMPKGLQASLPQRPSSLVNSSLEQSIVVQVFGHPDASPTYKINDVDVQLSQLQSKLTDIFANRAERVMFVKSNDNVSFATIAEVIDIGKAANVDHIGLMTPKSQNDSLQ
jgi:biopolymer transport protein TolR